MMSKGRVLHIEQENKLQDMTRLQSHRADNEVGRRWLSLEDQIARRLYMGE